MSSSTAGSPNPSRYVEFDEYVDLKLQKTRSTIKSTDLLVALAGVAAMFLGYLLVFVVLDQWVVPGGFGIVFRWLLLSTLLVLTVAWLGWKVGVPYLRSVNRLYAAQEIEKADPELRSSLLNLVDLRDSGREVNPTILRTLEKRAAVELQKIDVTQAIDHRPLMRISYVLLGVVVLFSLYALFSPKKIANSIWRSLLPSAQVGVATRTEILRVEPGNSEILAGQTVDVSADLAGEVPNKVALYFSTIDGAYQNERVELRVDGPSGTRFKGTLLGENGKGILQDTTYRVRAGDAESAEYRIHVKQPPQASGHNIKIEFPTYMKLEPIEQSTGHIDSWEGARVTLLAHTNMPIKSATVELLDENSTSEKHEEVPVIVSGDGQQLHASWKLEFRTDGTYAKKYRIQCRTAAGETDPSPIVHSLTIHADQKPEVKFLDPVRDLEKPANSVLPLLIEARDPDFEVSHVSLHIKKNGQEVDRVPLSDGRQQRVLIKHDLKLDQRMALVAGDLVELWVEAYDNKQPRPNRNNTPELKVKIAEPVTPKEAEQKLAEDRKNRDQRQQEAEQEQNAGQRPEQPMQNGDDEPREQREPQAQQDPMPNRPQDAKEPKQGEEQGQGGSSGKSKKNGASAGKGGEADKQSSPEKDGADSQQQGGKQKGESNKPLNPNGEDDGDALKKLIDKLGGKQSKKPDQKSSDNDAAQNDPQNQPQDDPKTESQADAPKGKQGTKPSDKTNSSFDDKKSDGDQSADPMPNGDKQNGGKSKEDKSSEEKPATKGQQEGRDSQKAGDPSQPMPKADTSKPEESKPDGSKPEGSKPEGSKPDAPKGSSSSQEKMTMPKDAGSGDSKDQNGDEPKTKKPQSSNQEGEDKQGQGSTPKSMDPKSKEPNKSGDTTGDHDQPEKTGNAPKKPEAGNDPAMRSQESSDEQRPGSDSEQKPKKPGTAESTEKSNEKKAGPESEMSGEPGGAGMPDDKPAKKEGEKEGSGEQNTNSSANGEKERTNDPGDAKREKATGNETGKAQPDNDPDAKTTQSKNPGLHRDPNEKPATRPGESKTNDSGETTPGDPAKPKPKIADKNQPKIEQSDQDNQSGEAPKRTEKRDGDPNTANEPKKGEGAKEQRSNSPTAGGEGGSSKQDKEGNKGSNQSGKGDESGRPGEEQTGEMKEQQPGGKKQPGKGKKTDDGKGRKADEGQMADDSGEKPNPANDPNRAPKSNQATDQKKDGTGESDSNDPSQKQNPSGSKPGENPQKPGSKDGGEQKPAGQKPGKPEAGGKESGGAKSGSEKADGGKPGESSQGQGEGQGQEGQGEGQGKSGQGKGKGKSNGTPSGKGGGGSGGKAGGENNGNGSFGNDSASNPDVNDSKGMDESTLDDGEEANLEYTKQATELVLKRLHDQLDRGDVDPELLKELGWTEAQMRQFTERIGKYLDETKSDDSTPESLARRQQFEEMLKSLDLKKRGVTRTGEKAEKRDVSQIDARQRTVPQAYRTALDKITKELNRQKPRTTNTGK